MRRAWRAGPNLRGHRIDRGPTGRASDTSGHGATNRQPRRRLLNRPKSRSRVIRVTPASRHDAASNASCTSDGCASAVHSSRFASVASSLPAAEKASADGVNTRLARAKRCTTSCSSSFACPGVRAPARNSRITMALRQVR